MPLQLTVIENGRDLIEVKQALEHGQYRVAAHLGGKAIAPA
jgi:hypothetical protein